MKEKILSLLETKFQGTRKDGLSILAGVLAMTASDEETAQKVVDALTADQVKDFIADYRKGADAETTKAIQTAEKNLRDKYDFVDKQKKDEPKIEPKPSSDFEALIEKATAPLIAEINALKGKGVKAARREKFNGAIGNIPESVKKILSENFEKTEFKDDEEFNAYLQTATETANTLAKEMSDKKLSLMYAPNRANVDTSDVSGSMKAYVESKHKK